MQYIETPKPSQQPQAPAAGADKYHGAIAEGYDAKRENDPKWVIEQRVITEMLSDLPAGSRVLDVPVGTGRFLDFYGSKKFLFVGADRSGDMLVQSALKLLPQEKVEEWVAACNKAGRIIPLTIKDRGVLLQGDVRKIGLGDKSVEAAVMCRLTRWLTPDECQVAFRELQRVASKRVVWTARVANHIHARSLELFEQALLPGWRITRNEAGYVMDYRVLEARPE